MKTVEERLRTPTATTEHAGKADSASGHRRTGTFTVCTPKRPIFGLHTTRQARSARTVTTIRREIPRGEVGCSLTPAVAATRRQAVTKGPTTTNGDPATAHHTRTHTEAVAGERTSLLARYTAAVDVSTTITDSSLPLPAVPSSSLKPTPRSTPV